MLTGRSDLYQDPLSPEGAGNNPGAWCVCGVCREMPDEQENVCCRKRTCVTSYVMFKTVCLDREVLQLAIRARCDIRGGGARVFHPKLQESGIQTVHLVEVWEAWERKP